MSAYHQRNLYEQVTKMSDEARLLGEARMLRDEQDLTPEITAAIIKRYRMFIERAGKSDAWAAKSLGISAPTLSAVLSGSYAGDKESQIRRLDKWLEIQIAREQAPKPGGFAKTGTALEIIGAAKMVQKIGGIAVVHGPSGCGKTLTAEYIRSENPGSIYIRITTVGINKAPLYDMIGRELRLSGLKLTSYQMQNEVTRLLKDSNRLLIFDEVHKLCKRGKDEGLNVLRDLQDLTGCPMLWLGTSDVVTYIESGRNAFESLDQIAGRVSWYVDLTTPASRVDGGPGLHTIEDIRRICAANQIRLAPDADQFITDLSNVPRAGGLRTVMRLCQMAMHKAPGKHITVEMLQDFQADRLGTRAATQIQGKMRQKVARIA